MGFLGIAGAGIGGFFGGPGGAALGASLGGGLDANNSSASSAAQAQDFNAQQYASRWQTTVNDMRGAGLNPMLAYSQGVGQPGPGVNYQALNAGANLGAAYSSASNVSKQGELIDAQATNQRASAWQASSQTELINRQASEIVQRLERDLPGKTSDQLTALAQSLYSQAKLNNSLDLTNQSQRELNVGILHKIYSEIDVNVRDKILKDLDISAANNVNNFGRQFQQLKPFLDLIRSVFGKIH